MMKKKRGTNIIAGITLGLILAIHLLFRYESRDYEVRKYPDHIEILKYKGQEKEVVIPASLWGKKVTVIQSSAFMRNDNITSVKLPRYLEQIGWGAFYGCENLESVEFGENVKAISNSAFSRCIRLKEVSLNAGLVGIGKQAFQGTKELKKVIIPESVEWIGKLTFFQSGLEEVVFQGEKAYIDERAFWDTPWLKNQKEEFVICGEHVLIAYTGEEKIVQIPEGVKYLSSSFYRKGDIREVYLPDTVIEIGDATFFDCKDVTVYIPSSVEKIGKSSEIIYDVNRMEIVTTSDSYAERYAKENGIKCKIVDEITYPDIAEEMDSDN